MSQLLLVKNEGFLMPSEIERLDDYKEYLVAMKGEEGSLKENNVYKIVPRPENKRMLRSRWVLCKKINNETGVIKHKGRFVALGSQQVYGVDFLQTFAPTLAKESLRPLIWLTVLYDLYVMPIDINTAFLNGNIDTVTYVELPDILFSREEKRVSVGKLQKSLFGLKQAPQIWAKTLSAKIVALGFNRIVTDPCINFRYNKHLEFIGVYVDDLVIGAENETNARLVIAQLKDFFKLTELGVLKNMIGWEIIRDENSILVNQKSYIDKVLSKFNFNEANNVYNRMLPGSLLHEKLECEDCFDSTKYRQLNGLLLYISTCTGPDVAYAVGVMSIFQYLKGDHLVWTCYRYMFYLFKS
jgi:Reverse transcriptase (RNA-dependent DNA polymerase)